MNRYPIIGFDPSFRNWGYSVGSLDIDTLDVSISEIGTISTQKDTSKQIRVNCDDLRCFKHLYDNLKVIIDRIKPVFIFAEIPHGAQTARAAVSYAGSVALCAALCPSVIVVSARDLKITVGNKANTSKEEVIEWVHERHPNLPWKKSKTGTLHASNEHLADSIAAIYTGLKTSQFVDLRQSFLAFKQFTNGI